ncbi:hypothetical protein BGZ49_007226 [Haplosporangium sp. Z 27]|nr:hypothetical protein BGZ49_007226 [Haplosporangium sp. Z 27]
MALFTYIRSSFTSRPSNPSLSDSPTSSTSIQTASEATQIPEILWEIFSYLSQYELHSVSGVNRLWRSISSEFIQDEVLWKDTFTLQEQDICLARLGSIQVKSFHCMAQDKRTYPAFHEGIEEDVKGAWKKLVQTLSTLAEPKMDCHHVDEAGECTTKKPMPLNWKKIVYSGWNCFNERWDPLFQRHYEIFHGVRSLQLKHLAPGAVDLSCIFSQLLNLEELAIASSESPPFTFKRNCTITWKDRKDQHNGDQIRQQQHQPLKLHTFKLRQIIVDQDTLEMIISAFPNLHSLELKLMVSLVSYVKRIVDRPSFMEFLARQCPNLTHFHYSTSGTRITLEEFQQVYASFPKITSLSVPEQDAIPGSLNMFVDRLTSLEIESHEYSYATELGNRLHAYLCQAPLLLHLKAYRVKIVQERFVLDLVDPVNTQRQYSNPQDAFAQPIWACRDLKTLYLFVESQSQRPSSRENTMVSKMFGYISRVCPNLEDIALERTFFHTEIRSGLCLLSRCKKLKRLRIYTSLQPYLSERDLDWICLGMVEPDSSDRPSNSTCRKRDSLLGGITGALFGGHSKKPGVGGVSKSEREMWVDYTIQNLKRTLLKDDPETNAIARFEEMRHNTKKRALSASYAQGRNSYDYYLDPIEMTTLGGMEHVLFNLQTLLEESLKSSRYENKVCCWPDLEIFEIHQMVSWMTPILACQDLIHKLRPDLKRFRNID